MLLKLRLPSFLTGRLEFDGSGLLHEFEMGLDLVEEVIVAIEN